MDRILSCETLLLHVQTCAPAEQRGMSPDLGAESFSGFQDDDRNPLIRRAFNFSFLFPAPDFLCVILLTYCTRGQVVVKLE